MMTQTFSPAAVARAREAAGLTMRALSDLIGVTERTIARWEAGETVPSADDLHRLAVALDVPLDALYEAGS